MIPSPWFCILFNSVIGYAVGSLSEPIDITFASNCQPDGNGIIGIDLENHRNVPVIFKLRCLQGIFNLTLGPFSQTKFPATFTPAKDDDICLFTPLTNTGKFGIYIVASQSLEIVVDNSITCDTWVDPPRTVVRYESSCLSDKDDRTEITLVNTELVPLLFYIECWTSSYELEVDPGSRMSFPATIYRGDIDYGTDMYDGIEKEICQFWPWTPDGIQFIILDTDEHNQHTVHNFIYCQTSPTTDHPRIEVSSDCFPDPAGVIDININNLKDESVHFYLYCFNDWFPAELPPLGTMTFPAVFQRDYPFEYVPGACVLQIWSEHRIDNQLVWAFSEEADLDFTSSMFECKEIPPPPIRFGLTCQPDPFGLVPLRLENNLPTPVVFVAECLRFTSTLTLEPQTAVHTAAMFYKGKDADYVGDVCIMELPPLSNIDMTTALVYFTDSLDTGSNKQSTKLPGIVMSQRISEDIAWEKMFNDVMHYGGSLKPWTDDGIQGLYGAVSINPQVIFDNFLYCDTRLDPPKPVVQYETSCQTENSRTMIKLINNEAVPMNFTMKCKDTNHVLTLSPNSTLDFPAAFYAGDLNYGTANYAGEDQSVCLFKPWIAFDKQALFLTTQRPGQAALSHNIYCAAPFAVPPPDVIVGSTCQPDSGDTFDVFFHNKENDAVTLEIICGNNLYNFSLEADDTLTLPATYYRGEGHIYCPCTCAFMAYEVILDEEQYIYIYSEAQSSRKFERKRFYCEKKNPDTLHNGYVSTTCQLNNQGQVPIPVSNDGDHLLAFTLHCRNGNFKTLLQPGETRTLLAVYFQGEDITYPSDICVFNTSNTDTVQKIMVSVDIGGNEQEFTIENLACDLGQWPFKQFITAETYCRPNEAGEIAVILKNNGDTPISYSIRCWLNSIVLEVAPHSTQAFTAFFYNGSNGSDDICMFMPWSKSGWQSLLVHGVTEDQPQLFQYLYCETSTPDDPPNVEFQSTCSPGDAGIFLIQFTNNDDEEVSVRVFCANELYTVKLAPHSTSAFPTVFNEGDDHDYPHDTCVFMDLTKSFMTRQYVWIFSEKDGGQYTETNFFCEKSLPRQPGPIVRLIPHCGSTSFDLSSLELRADAPAYAMAKCRNGNKTFTTFDHVSYNLAARFDAVYTGQDCLFFRKEDSNTFTVDVEIGWGDVSTQVISNKDTRTVSCVYDDHGEDESVKEHISQWFISPKENQNLLGDISTAIFDLEVLDILDNVIDADDIPIGRKIRLRAVDISGMASAFRALSCDAVNEVTRYAILRAGCGDGLVFAKNAGFTTEGTSVFSPYFEAFKLRGDNSLRFQCRFTVCKSGRCDGDSCRVQTRKKRRISTDPAESTGLVTPTKLI